MTEAHALVHQVVTLVIYILRKWLTWQEYALGLAVPAPLAGEPLHRGLLKSLCVSRLNGHQPNHRFGSTTLLLAGESLYRVGL